jgi:hypothetical protein
MMHTRRTHHRCLALAALALTVGGATAASASQAPVSGGRFDHPRPVPRAADRIDAAPAGERPAFGGLMGPYPTESRTSDRAGAAVGVPVAADRLDPTSGPAAVPSQRASGPRDSVRATPAVTAPASHDSGFDWVALLAGVATAGLVLVGTAWVVVATRTRRAAGRVNPARAPRA